MKRSKNHILYELYLKEASNGEELFEKTKDISLGFIRFYSNHWIDVEDGNTDVIDVLNSYRASHRLEPVSEPEEFSDKDFHVYTSFSTLANLGEHMGLVANVCDRINAYHQNRK